MLLITFVAPLVARFALRFGPAEFFAVFFLTFCSFVGMGKENKAKIVASLCIGFLLAAVGLDTISGDLRMTFGLTELMRGFDFLVVVIGLFGISEILLTIEEGLHFKGKKAAIDLKVVLQDLGEPAPLLGDAAALVGRRDVDGRDAGRRHRRLVHGLRHRQALLAPSRKFRQGRDRGRAGARNGSACRRHLGAPAHAGARHPGLGHRRGACSAAC